MPLARKLRKKKNFIGVCYFALFSPAIMISSFRKISRKSRSLNFGFEKLNEEKMRFLSSNLRHKFDLIL